MCAQPVARLQIVCIAGACCVVVPATQRTAETRPRTTAEAERSQPKQLYIRPPTPFRGPWPTLSNKKVLRKHMDLGVKACPTKSNSYK